jgi:hypothetical protein
MTAVAASGSTTKGAGRQKEVTATARIYLQQMEIGIMTSTSIASTPGDVA